MGSWSYVVIAVDVQFDRLECAGAKRMRLKQSVTISMVDLANAELLEA